MKLHSRKNILHLHPQTIRGVAQLASAPALGAGGPVFESQYPDKKGMCIAHPFSFLIRLCIILSTPTRTVMPVQPNIRGE